MIENLNHTAIRIGFDGKTKNNLLKEIASIAAKELPSGSPKEAEILKALEQREEVSSTGLTDGIAIPHCLFPDLGSFLVGLFIIPQGIDFEAMDGKPSRLVFFIIGDENQRNKHIKILSSISQLSSDKNLLDTLLHSKTAEDAGQLLKRDEVKEIEKEGQSFCQFIIHVQSEGLFFNVLEILNSEVNGSITVLNSATAGSYLHKLPLFSALWTDEKNTYSRVIIAVVDKRLMNDTIRRIKMVNPKNRSGLLITVQDLLYTDGSIDF